MSKEEINIVFIVFFCVAIVIVLGIIFLFITFNNRKNKLIKENLETALQNQKRLHELELKALRGQMNPHFVHNSLNAIQYYIHQNDVETSENFLSKFSKLMRQFFDYSRRQKVTLNEEISLLKNYLEIEKLRFEDKFVFNIEIDDKLDLDEEHIPSMILQPIVENSVNHGLFHKQGKGNISILFRYLNECSYEVSVVDDGIGIKQSKALNTSIKKGNTSHSTTVMKERLFYLKMMNSWKIDYEIKDRSEEEKITGTRVTLTIQQNYEG